VVDFVKFEQFVEDVGSGVHDLRATGSRLKIYLSNTAPVVATNAAKADLTAITEQNDYGVDGSKSIEISGYNYSG